MSYSITSLDYKSSTFHKNGSFILVFNDCWIESDFYYGYTLTDDLPSRFTTMDMDRNNECARKFHSGWWFPFVFENLGSEFKRPLARTCAINGNNYTNLNGVFDRNITQNNRSIIFCEKKNPNDCIENLFNKFRYSPGKALWKLVGTESIKLKQTKIWLKWFKWTFI